MKSQRELEVRFIQADQDLPKHWSVELPLCCAACGQDVSGPLTEENRSVEEFTWSLWCPLIGFGLAVMLYLSGAFWIAVLTAMIGIFAGSKLCRKRSVTLRFACCPEHAELEYPLVRAHGNDLIVRVGSKQAQQATKKKMDQEWLGTRNTGGDPAVAPFAASPVREPAVQGLPDQPPAAGRFPRGEEPAVETASTELPQEQQGPPDVARHCPRCQAITDRNSKECGECAFPLVDGRCCVCSTRINTTTLGYLKLKKEWSPDLAIGEMDPEDSHECCVLGELFLWSDDGRRGLCLRCGESVALGRQSRHVVRRESPMRDLFSRKSATPSEHATFWESSPASTMTRCPRCAADYFILRSGSAARSWKADEHPDAFRIGRLRWVIQQLELGVGADVFASGGVGSLIDGFEGFFTGAMLSGQAAAQQNKEAKLLAAKLVTLLHELHGLTDYKYALDVEKEAARQPSKTKEQELAVPTVDADRDTLQQLAEHPQATPGEHNRTIRGSIVSAKFVCLTLLATLLLTIIAALGIGWLVDQRVADPEAGLVTGFWVVVAGTPILIALLNRLCAATQVTLTNSQSGVACEIVQRLIGVPLSRRQLTLASGDHLLKQIDTKWGKLSLVAREYGNKPFVLYLKKLKVDEPLHSDPPRVSQFSDVFAAAGIPTVLSED